MDELEFYVPFNSISIISRRWKGEHERHCAMKVREESRLQRDLTPWSEVGSANHLATRTLLKHVKLTLSPFGTFWYAAVQILKKSKTEMEIKHFQM